MTRLEKCVMAKEKGVTYDEKTGKIFNIGGSECKRLRNGYISFSVSANNRDYNLYGHIFAWYFKHGLIVDFLDHKNKIRTDNRIDNLRSVTKLQNNCNRTGVKGYYYDKSRDKYCATITYLGKTKYLGRFENEAEAEKAYLEAKKKYHVI